jgi:hypothetical protein
VRSPTSASLEQQLETTINDCAGRLRFLFSLQKQKTLLCPIKENEKTFLMICRAQTSVAISLK